MTNKKKNVDKGGVHVPICISDSKRIMGHVFPVEILRHFKYRALGRAYDEYTNKKGEQKNTNNKQNEMKSS